MKVSKFVMALLGLIVMFSFVVACDAEATDATPTSVPVVTLAVTEMPKDDNPTSGAIVRSTHQAELTLSAKSTHDAQATMELQTAQAHRDETATVVARVTGESVFAAKSTWPVVLTESFRNNTLGWPLGVTTDQSPVVTADIANGGYEWALVVPHSRSFINLIPENIAKFSTFYASVSLQFMTEDDGRQTSYGLVFRRVGRNYGFFGISPSGDFRVLEVHSGGIESLEQESSDLIDTRPGKVNRLSVVAIGPDFVFLINGQKVGQMNAELDAGQIGLGIDALNSADQSKVRFSDFEVAAP